LKIVAKSERLLLTKSLQRTVRGWNGIGLSKDAPALNSAPAGQAPAIVIPCVSNDGHDNSTKFRMV
jgi:hypothetical protein